MRLFNLGLTIASTFLLVAGCGGSSHTDFGDKVRGGAGGAAGTFSKGGGAGLAEHAGKSSGAGTGGMTGGTGSSGAAAGTGGSKAGAAGSGNTGTGGNGTGGHGTGGDGAKGGSAGTSQGGANTGGSSSGTGGDAGSAGEPAIACTGSMQYFPEFDRSCTIDDDCIPVIHQTSCCGAESAFAINEREHDAYDAAEATCDAQYPACGCASFGIDVEDGTRVDFSAKDTIAARCDAGTCKAHYTGVSFECGTLRCTEKQYCVESSGGPAGTPTSYSCNPTGCTDCTCTAMPGCACSQTDGHLTFTCQNP